MVVVSGKVIGMRQVNPVQRGSACFVSCLRGTGGFVLILLKMSDFEI